MKHLILSLILVASAPGLAGAAEAKKNGKQLRAMAKQASTPAAHREVARDYRTWADQLDHKARKHEAEAERLAKDTSYNPMRQKWPAIAAGPLERHRHLAAQARRAANEARLLAEEHGRRGDSQAQQLTAGRGH